MGETFRRFKAEMRRDTARRFGSSSLCSLIESHEVLPPPFKGPRSSFSRPFAIPARDTSRFGGSNKSDDGKNDEKR
ncbi:hypothetical protein PC116_g17367 [Phytophthora cactorum]|uniref:Uncharacterized protein n=1 Tax=Phytophthora cactorum TaxID=29920 RepID=A0A8T1KES8_9STRA|nr:hypothetical protein PC112_g13368 [Phytophthora cactorum]KAG2853980.1 hypothetical protein PC113_g13704 [Phytophthora cactorum]KAG2897901.1 hypothetical protein PC114_g14496 [Phytophthora cactorum]KAG2911137.1 hypothetical protein PC115_g12665 [Phytophthora cactorum]KAG2929384.1 hypothetical protein PC117_g14014 [Phytophthora cactorum]